MSDYGVLLQQVINGLSLGAMYALLALGFTLVYGILELINFAHFNVFMVASFVGMWALELLGISGQGQVLSGMALIGRYSLEVFCVGLFVSWGATTALHLLPGEPLLDPVLIGVGSLLLALFARRLDRRRSARRVVVAA